MGFLDRRRFASLGLGLIQTINALFLHFRVSGRSIHSAASRRAFRPVRQCHLATPLHSITDQPPSAWDHMYVTREGCNFRLSARRRKKPSQTCIPSKLDWPRLWLHAKRASEQVCPCPWTCMCPAVQIIASVGQQEQHGCVLCNPFSLEKVDSIFAFRYECCDD